MSNSKNIYCAQCGAENNHEDRFCGECGSAIGVPESTPKVATPSFTVKKTEPRTKAKKSKPKVSKRWLRILVFTLLPVLILFSYAVIIEIGNPGFVEALAISQDGFYLASGGSDGKVMVWKFPEMDLLLEINCAQSITKLVFNQKGDRLAVANGASMAVYAISGDEAKKILTAKDEGIKALCLDEESVYGLNFHGELKVWNKAKEWSGMSTGDDLQKVVEASHSTYPRISLATFSPDCRRLAINLSSDQVYLNLYRVEEVTFPGQKVIQDDGRLKAEPTPYAEPEALAFSSDGKYLVVLNEYYAFVWDYATQRLKKKTKLVSSAGDAPLVVDRNLKNILVGWGNGTIEFLDMESGQTTATYYHGPAWYRMLRSIFL